MSAHGSGRVTAGSVGTAVFSLSARSATGADAAYIEWHALDHLPEQFRIGGLRWGQRWVSTPRCRDARAASEGRWDAIDHVVNYLFAEPADAALGEFFDLGHRLRQLGRIPDRLPRVHLGCFDVVGAVAAPRVVVDPAVVPMRPNRGVYLLVEAVGPSTGAAAVDPRPFLEADGVAGVWWFRSTPGHHPGFDDAGDLLVTVCYLDDDPVVVAGRLAPALESRRARGLRPLLAAPLEALVAWDWARQVP